MTSGFFHVKFVANDEFAFADSKLKKTIFTENFYVLSVEVLNWFW